MKSILMQITIFLASRGLKKFLMIFFISFLIIISILYFVLKKKMENSDIKRVKIFTYQLSEVFNMPHTTNNNILIEYSFINPDDLPLEDSEHLFEPDAVNYRYSIPKYGNPNHKS